MNIHCGEGTVSHSYFLKNFVQKFENATSEFLACNPVYNKIHQFPRRILKNILKSTLNDYVEQI